MHMLIVIMSAMGEVLVFAAGAMVLLAAASTAI